MSKYAKDYHDIEDPEVDPDPKDPVSTASGGGDEAADEETQRKLREAFEANRARRKKEELDED